MGWSTGLAGPTASSGTHLFGTCTRYNHFMLYSHLQQGVTRGTTWRVQSHHVPRKGPFELNDIFAIINAGPAILLLAYGFFTKGFFPGLCFGAVHMLLPACSLPAVRP